VTPAPDAQDKPFRVDEATIDELHTAIKSGRTTCLAVVQQYIDRVRAYNGVASLLVTEDGNPIPAMNGAVRALAPLRFPTETVKASVVLFFVGPRFTVSLLQSTGGYSSRSGLYRRIVRSGFWVLHDGSGGR
jgi:hypothetical protein